jgi:hypothetical protein
MCFRRFCLISIALFALVFPAPPICASQPPLGILTLATHAKLDESAAFPGLSVYDGERLSTEAGGRLSLRAGHSEITLGEKTEIELIRLDGGGVHVDMEAGSIQFSSPEKGIIEVHTADAIVRPAGDQPTQAAIALLSPKALQITAEHGTLHFSYRDEERNLPEGQTYRVYLDTDDPQPMPAGGAQTAGSTSKLTYFIVGAETSGAAGVAAWGVDHALHSSNPPH